MPAAKSPPLPSPTKSRSAEKAVGGATNNSKDAVKLPSISRSSSPSTPTKKGIEEAASSVPKGAKTPAASPSRANAKNNRAAKSSVAPIVKIEPPLSSLPAPSSQEQAEDVSSVIADTPSESPTEQPQNGSATADAESEAQSQGEAQAQAATAAMAEAERMRKIVREESRGVYQGLEKDTTYYVVVEQEADQLRRDQEATRAKWDPEIKRQKDIESDGRGFETCSCVYGNPCVDEYGCKDWHARFAVATANGWKGF